MNILEAPKAKEKFEIYHKVSCKSNYVIYLLECLPCKIQFVRKSETPVYSILKIIKVA